MQFTSHKHRQAPSVIIVSLIDVLLVVLIYLVVTTTAKQQPAVKLALPQSKRQKTGSSPNSPLEVSITKEGILYLQKDPVTSDILLKRLTDAVHANSSVTLAIRADKAAGWGLVANVINIASSAGIKMSVEAYLQPSGQ